MLVLMWVFLATFAPMNTQKYVNLAGVSLCAIGAYMLASGYVESMLLAAAAWDGSKFIHEMLPKQGRLFRRGVLLVLAGSLLQALSLAW